MAHPINLLRVKLHHDDIQPLFRYLSFVSKPGPQLTVGGYAASPHSHEALPAQGYAKNDTSYHKRQNQNDKCHNG